MSRQVDEMESGWMYPLGSASGSAKEHRGLLMNYLKRSEESVKPVQSLSDGIQTLYRSIQSTGFMSKAPSGEK